MKTQNITSNHLDNQIWNPGYTLPSRVRGLPKESDSYDAFWGLILILGASFILVVYADYTKEHIKISSDVVIAFLEVITGLILISVAARHFLRER